MIIDPNAPPKASRAVVIKDGDARSFAADVIRASMTVPVIVDFWAPWCGPCKQLTPALEKLVRQAAGAVQLVKINIDENQDLAAQLRIQSVPTVYAFVEGRPVDAFVGAVPESQLRQFVERLTRSAVSPLDEIITKAQAALDAGDGKLAGELFQRVLAQDPRHPKAIAGAVRARVLKGEIAAARSLLDGLPRDLLGNSDIVAARSAIDVAEQAKAAGDLGKLRARVAAAPADQQARLDLATAMFGRGLSEAAIDEVLAMIKADRTWNGEAARKQLLKFLEALGPSHPLTAAARRKLSTILFS